VGSREKARAAKMTIAERKASALKAIKARWTALSLCLLCLFPPLCLPRHSSPRLGYCIPRGKLCAGGKAPTWRALLHVSLGTNPFLIVIAASRRRPRPRRPVAEARLSRRTLVTMRCYRLGPSWSMLPRCVLAHDKPGPTMALALHRHHRARTTARKDPATTGSMMPPVAKPKHKLI